MEVVSNPVGLLLGAATALVILLSVLLRFVF